MYNVFVKWSISYYTTELEPGHGSPGRRVTGSPGQWLCPGRVRSRVKVIYLQTRYRDPVADRTTEWYRMVNTWTHSAKWRLNEHASVELETL